MQSELRSPLVRQTVREMEAYAPPEDPQRLARVLGVPVEQIVKLDANENPYGCSPRVAEALGQCGGYHLYPDPDQEEARHLVAAYAGVEPAQVMLGNGSDELIDLLMRALLDPGDELLDFSPSFAMYAFNAQHYAARVVEVPRDEAFDIDPELAFRVASLRTRLALVAAPNNPTGNPVRPEVLERLLEGGWIVAVDEAYAEFCGTSFAPLVRERENLVALRTFSKWAGLAGLRVGYAILPQGLAAHLWKLKPPFNVNVAALAAAKATLGDLDYLRANIARIVAERDRLIAALAGVPYLRPYPSEGNFVLCRVVGRDAFQLRQALVQRGILIRHYRHPRLRDCIRISVGRPQDTEALLAALSSW
ncbi:MAG: histidinol-phosphate transaminase [Chloroflexi bacterium]|nr:histidinol-phosphate transaminase [Chloroflexota bacterium]